MAKKDESGDVKILNTTLEKIASEKISDDKKSNAAVENLRTALANLGLKIIDDINSKRVHKPEEVYNALVSIYNAIK
ncbi:MAG: hypothetical protein IKP64_09515 [Selenomonadaceae bacterium]|nr:hypothetical protein [Selenomonadaceae bacterium]